jgi:hypothetical protein
MKAILSHVTSARALGPTRTAAATGARESEREDDEDPAFVPGQSFSRNAWSIMRASAAVRAQRHRNAE